MKRRDFIAALAATSALSTPPDAELATWSSAAARPVTVTLLGAGTPAPPLTRQSSGCLIEVGAIETRQG